ncbi:hypothetical protein GCM10010440_46940 [Kitasatospora cinereorecta]
MERLPHASDQGHAHAPSDPPDGMSALTEDTARRLPPTTERDGASPVGRLPGSVAEPITVGPRDRCPRLPR